MRKRDGSRHKKGKRSFKARRSGDPLKTFKARRKTK